MKLAKNPRFADDRDVRFGNPKITTNTHAKIANRAQNARTEKYESKLTPRNNNQSSDPRLGRLEEDERILEVNEIAARHARFVEKTRGNKTSSGANKENSTVAAQQGGLTLVENMRMQTAMTESVGEEKGNNNNDDNNNYYYNENKNNYYNNECTGNSARGNGVEEEGRCAPRNNECEELEACVVPALSGNKEEHKQKIAESGIINRRESFRLKSRVKMERLDRSPPMIPRFRKTFTNFLVNMEERLERAVMFLDIMHKDYNPKTPEPDPLDFAGRVHRSQSTEKNTVVRVNEGDLSICPEGLKISRTVELEPDYQTIEEEREWNKNLGKLTKNRVEYLNVSGNDFRACSGNVKLLRERSRKSVGFRKGMQSDQAGLKGGDWRLSTHPQHRSLMRSHATPQRDGSLAGRRRSISVTSIHADQAHSDRQTPTLVFRSRGPASGIRSNNSSHAGSRASSRPASSRPMSSSNLSKSFPSACPTPSTRTPSRTPPASRPHSAMESFSSSFHSSENNSNYSRRVGTHPPKKNCPPSAKQMLEASLAQTAWPLHISSHGGRFEMDDYLESSSLDFGPYFSSNPSSNSAPSYFTKRPGVGLNPSVENKEEPRITMHTLSRAQGGGNELSRRSLFEHEEESAEESSKKSIVKRRVQRKDSMVGGTGTVTTIPKYEGLKRGISKYERFRQNLSSNISLHTQQKYVYTSE